MSRHWKVRARDDHRKKHVSIDVVNWRTQRQSILVAWFVAATIVMMIALRPAKAELLAYESFEYSEATTGDVLTGRNGGIGWATPWQAHTSWQPLRITPSPGLETLSNSTPLPAGSQTTTTSNGPRGGYAYNPSEVLSGSMPYGRLSSRQLAQPIDMSVDQTTYMSFLFRRVTDPNGTFNNLRAVLSLNNGPHPVNDAQIQIGAPSTGGTNSMQAFLTGSVVDSNASDDGVINETTYLVVAKIEAHAGNTADRVFFERYKPGSSLELPNPWDKFSTSSINNETLDHLMLWGENAWSVDEIRIGTTFASVTTEPVPEPSSLLLFVVGATCLFVARRATMCHASVR